jgi:hypothetical protein
MRKSSSAVPSYAMPPKFPRSYPDLLRSEPEHILHLLNHSSPVTKTARMVNKLCMLHGYGIVTLRGIPAAFSIIHSYKVLYRSSRSNHTSSLLRTFSRATLAATSPPCCSDMAPRMAKSDVFRTTLIPDPSRFSGYRAGQVSVCLMFVSYCARACLPSSASTA